MDGIELKARREALGLDNAGFAAALHLDTSAITEFEGTARGIPDSMATRLDKLELARDTIAGVLEDALPGDLATYATDAEFWSEWPEYHGVPASVHRVAAADALRSARWAGIQARIVPAHRHAAEESPRTAR